VEVWRSGGLECRNDVYGCVEKDILEMVDLLPIGEAREVLL
jgi:hypothetical protein